MKTLRKEKGITLESIAKKLHVSKQYIWDIEEGRRVLSYKMAFSIAYILDTTPDDLFLEELKKK